jgi:hypothetical protein
VDDLKGTDEKFTGWTLVDFAKKKHGWQEKRLDTIHAKCCFSTHVLRPKCWTFEVYVDTNLGPRTDSLGISRACFSRLSLLLEVSCSKMLIATKSMNLPQHHTLKRWLLALLVASSSLNSLKSPFFGLVIPSTEKKHAMMVIAPHINAINTISIVV